MIVFPYRGAWDESDTKHSLALSPLPHPKHVESSAIGLIELVVPGWPRGSYFGEIYKVSTIFKRLYTMWLAVWKHVVGFVLGFR